MIAQSNQSREIAPNATGNAGSGKGTGVVVASETETFVVEEISESGIQISSEEAREAIENLDFDVSVRADAAPTVTSIADEIDCANEGVLENEETPGETAKVIGTTGLAGRIVPSISPAPAVTIIPVVSADHLTQDMPNLLAQACLEGRLRDIMNLLDAGADPNGKGSATTDDGKKHSGLTPLGATILATVSEEVTPKMLRKQTARIVKLLLARGGMATEIERDLLTHCANHNLAEVLDVLGENKLRLRRYAYDLMGIALHHGHTEVIDILSKHGCSVNILNDRGNRPFLDLCSRTLRSPITQKSSASGRAEEMAERISGFVGCGLNLEATDKVGSTALLRAVATGNEVMAWALLSNGANPRVVMRNGVSITHLAAACMGPSFLRKFMPMTGTFSELARLNANRLQPDVRAMIEAAKAV